MSIISRAISLKKYGFLLEQLVKRDFKVRYKRSLLGVLWSALNPLLTMVVLAIVFSQIFTETTKNFPVYLITGLIMINYMVESTNQAMLSITSNFGLINKVYIPKYIFPFSKILSTAINLLMSILAMYAIVIITGLPITLTHLLLVYPILCLMVFSTGLGFMLSCSQVFFRDTQYLYSIITLLWTYLSPIFYDISIIPKSYQNIYMINPMYQIITFVRSIVLDNTIPSGYSFLFCAIWAIGMLVAGLLVFRKTQNNFIYYA